MSKSKKNVIDPIDIIDQFGADTARWFVMSDSPPDRDISWSTEGVEGAWRHLNRVWRLTKEIAIELKKSRQRAGVGKDRQIDDYIFNTSKFIESFSFNKAIAKIYELTNFLARKDTRIEQRIYGIKALAITNGTIYPSLITRNLGNNRRKRGLLLKLNGQISKSGLARKKKNNSPYSDKWKKKN